MTNTPESKKKISFFKSKKFLSFLVIFITIALFGLTFGFSSFVNSMIAKGMKNYVPQPATISSGKVIQRPWPQVINTVGEAQATQTTEISSQSAGIITDINFKSGQFVKKGDLLFKLDTTQLEASLAEAKAKLKLAKLTNDRYENLIKQKATSKESADQANSDYLSALAEVDNIKSQINYKIIKAPFDGKIGIRNISVGQFFNMGDNAATLTTISPIYISFTVTQNVVDKIKKGDEITFKSDTYPNKQFKAKIYAINSFINSDNRSIIVQAIYPNKKHEILPGMFVTVNVELPTIKDAIIVPRNAITYSLYGESVFTLNAIKDKNGKIVKATYSQGPKTIHSDKDLYKVGSKSIKVLETRGNFARVSGIKPNTVIVTSGQNKIHKGSNALINNEVTFNNNIYSKKEK